MTKKKLRRLWHILLSKASNRLLSRSDAFKYQILKQYTAYNLQKIRKYSLKNVHNRQKYKTKNTVAAWCRPHHVSVTCGSHFHLLRDFFNIKKQSVSTTPGWSNQGWTNKNFALKWVCSRVSRSQQRPPQSPFVAGWRRRLLIHPSICLHSYFEQWPTTLLTGAADPGIGRRLQSCSWVV